MSDLMHNTLYSLNDLQNCGNAVGSTIGAVPADRKKIFLYLSALRKFALNLHPIYQE